MPSQIEMLLEAEKRGILPENKVAMLAEARKRGLIEGGKAPDEQPAAQPAEQPAEGIIQRAAKNLPGSAMQFAKDVTAPIHSPIQTAKGIGAVVEGTVQKSIKDRWRAQGFKIDKDESERASEAMANFITDRYGGVENIKETIAEDPVGFLADAAMVFTGGAGAVAKGAGLAGKAGRVASVAGKVGKVAEKWGLWEEPSSLLLLWASWAAVRQNRLPRKGARQSRKCSASLPGPPQHQSKLPTNRVRLVARRARCS